MHDRPESCAEGAKAEVDGRKAAMRAAVNFMVYLFVVL